MMTSRAEHLDWCKQRALKYVDAGDFGQAITSMLLDLRKHPETENHGGIKLGFALLAAGQLRTGAEARTFIEGFN